MLRDTSAASTSRRSVVCAATLPSNADRASNSTATTAACIREILIISVRISRPTAPRKGVAGRRPQPHIFAGGTSIMHIAQTRLSIDTAPREIKEITAEVAEWTERQHVSVGLLTLYIPHTSASLLIQENA